MNQNTEIELIVIIIIFLQHIFHTFENMQKVTSILFSTLILFQSLSISAEDFTKFSVLIEHAQFHQETYGDSFFEFIVEHYVNHDHHDVVEHQEHEDLPFKHSQQNCSQIHSVFVLNPIGFQLRKQEQKRVPLNFFYKESHSIFEKTSVFQPPKSA